MSENSEVMVIDEIINNMEIDDVLEEIEDIENPVVELEVDSEFEVIDKRQSLQESYNEYNESYVELSELLRTILATGEYTEENKQQILETNDVYDEKYKTVVKEMDKAKSTIESNKALDFNGSILMNTQDDVFNALTKNGEVQAIYRDSEGKIYINAQYLQTRGLTVVNDNNQVTLKIDNKGNLTTSGDIVGGTITGSVMKAMTINTNEVNITSNDGGMSINGALQKFSDERGNVRILIGKDTDGSFKFMLYGENGSTVLIDKNGIKSEAISAGTIKTDHLAPNSISTKHLKTDVMEAVDAKVENMTADKATIGQLNATNAQINQLNANKANVSDLTATNAKVENLTVNKANVSDLNATNATVSNLKAETAKINQAVINKADIGQLNATNANIGTLQANVAKIDNVLAGNITSENIQAGSITSKDLATGTITAGSGIIADGAIGSAQISSLDASKITAGKIDTSKVEVAGANNHLKIKGNRLQVFQGTGSSAKERVSLGDVNGNGTVYGLRVRGADGKTVLLDENGVTNEGITDGSITNDKISDNAQIDGAKLNIDSVINKINDDGTETINGTKIEVDGQNLNAKLSTITNKQTSDGEKITQAQSQISANTNAIKLKVDDQTYQTDKKTMTNTMNKNTSAIDVMKGQIALKVEQTDINNAKSELEGSIDSKISSAKGEIKVTTDKISQSVSSLTQKVNTKADNSTVTSVSNKVASLETNLSGITQRVSSTETKTETLTSDMSKVDGKINTAKQSAITTASNDATTKANNALANAKSYTNGEITKTNNAVSEINTSLSGITQRVSKVETSTTTLGTKIDNIQVGGRNYIKNSQKVYMKPNGTNNYDLTFKLCDSFWENSSRFGIVTISFDVKTDSTLSEDFSSNIWFRATPWYSFPKWTYPKGTTDKKSYSLQLDLKSMATSYKTTELFVRFQAKDTVGMTFTNVKLEIGTKKTDWTPAPEDTAVEIEEKINSAKAEIKTTTDSISQSVSSLTQKVNTKADGSTVSNLSNKVASIETNLNGITQKVSSVESTTATLTTKVNSAQNTANSANTNATNAMNKANSANSLADSKAKIFTTTPTTPYKIGDLWVQGTTGDVMRCKTARSSGNYVASDWEKASKYTDDTKANAVDGRVTTLQGTVNTTNNKVASIETNLNGITQRVSATESTTSTLTTKVNTAQNTADSAKTTATNAQNTANTANSTANTNKSNIASLQTTISSTNSKVSSLETNLSGITQRVSATETKTTTVSNKLDNLKIGGRNLARNTSTPITLSDFKGSTNYCSSSYAVEGVSSLKVGDVLTISYDFEYTNLVGNTGKSIYLHGWGEQTNWDGSVNIANATLNITWGNTAKQTVRVVSSMTVNAQTLKNTKFHLRLRTDNITGGSFTVKNFMVERADKPSEWSPAPEDVDSSISTVNGKVDTANKNISSLTSRVSTAESKLTKDSLTTTIGKHYTTSSDVDGIVSSKGYQSQSQVQQTVNSLQAKFTSSGGYNLLRNGCAKNGTAYWSNNGGGISVGTAGSGSGLGEGATYFDSNFPSGITGEWIILKPNTDYIYSAKLWSASSFKGTLSTPLHYWCSSTKTSGSTQLTVIDYKSECKANEWNDVYVHFKTKSGTVYFKPFIYLGGTTNINFSVSEIMLCEGMIKSPYSPHPSEVYDGITQIDKDGLKVKQSNINGYTQMSANGFYVNKGGEDVIKVTSDGVYVKGKVDIVGGSVPTSSLTGTVSSSQLNSSVVSDINAAKNNASTALSTANTAKSTADSAKTTATNAQNTANTAKSTADSANTTASAVKKTVDANSTNWSNAYNRVKEWANGAVTGSTSINGGMIATNTITANKIAVGDFNNYSQLQKGRNLTNTYGNAIWSEANAEWTTSNAYFPFTLDNTDNAFNVGDKINIKCSVWVNQSASLPIGVWFYDSNKVNTGSNTSTKAINAGWNHLNFELTLSHDSIKKSPYMQILIKTEGNSIAVKDVVVTRKVSGEMLIDGAVTASKLHADAINGKKITGVDIVGSTFSSTSGNFKVLNDGTVDATSLSVNDEISTETLTVQKINNSKYQTVLDKDLIININAAAASNSQIFENDATYKSVSAFLDACPQNLNGHTVLLNFQSNLTENIEISKLHSGELTLQLNQKIIYGYVYLVGDSMRYRMYGDNPSTINGSKYGSIMPNIGMSQAGGRYSLVMHSSHGFFYDLKVYGGKSTDSNIGIRIGNWSSAYLSNINFIGCYNGLRAYNLSKAYIVSSAGTTTSYAFSSYHGSQVVLNPTTQAGKAGATSHVFISNNSTVTSAGVTWSSSAISGSNTNSSTTKVEKTVTINSTLGDSYRSTVYNNWKKDSTVRQGNYGYGNCEGCWFYGDQFVPYQSKEITKVEITIKRQAGGVAGAVTHTLKMHNYTTRPSGRPTFSTALSKNFSVATNNSITVALTTAAEINAFKANKGFGLVPTAQNSTYYSVCSGSAQVKITYKE